MTVLVGVFGFLAIAMTDSAQEFAKHSNRSNVYDFVAPRSCATGLRETGYSWSVGGGIVLKERSLDGSTGPVCNDE